MIEATIGDYFSARVKRKGEDYFRQGRVQGLSSDGNQLRAEVRGSEPYEVELCFDDDEMCG